MRRLISTFLAIFMVVEASAMVFAEYATVNKHWLRASGGKVIDASV